MHAAVATAADDEQGHDVDAPLHQEAVESPVALPLEPALRLLDEAARREPADARETTTGEERRAIAEHPHLDAVELGGDQDRLGRVRRTRRRHSVTSSVALPIRTQRTRTFGTPRCSSNQSRAFASHQPGSMSKAAGSEMR